MVDITRTSYVNHLHDSTVGRGEPVHVEIDGKHFIVTPYTTDPASITAQTATGLRVYEVTENGSGTLTLVNQDEFAYSNVTSPDALAVQNSGAFAEITKPTVFQKDGVTYLAENSDNHYIIWSINAQGELAEEQVIPKDPATYAGLNKTIDDLEVHVGDDGSVTLIHGGAATGSPAINLTDHSIWHTRLNSDFSVASTPSEVTHNMALNHANATANADMRDVEMIELPNNEKMIYAFGDGNSVPVWKMDANGNLTELPPVTNLPANDNAIGGSAGSGYNVDHIVDPSTGKIYMAVSGRHIQYYESGLYEVNPVDGSLVRLSGQMPWNTTNRFSDTAPPNDAAWSPTQINSIDLKIDDAGDLYLVASSPFVNGDATGDYTEVAHTSGVIMTYKINPTTFAFEAVEATSGTDVTGLHDHSVTFEMNGQTITVGTDAWGTHGDQPYGGWSIWSQSVVLNESVVCYASGTLIATPTGDVPIESLSVGDKVTVSDGAASEVRWIGKRTVKAQENLAPVRIKQNALASGVPQRDLLVSRQHRMVVSSDFAEEKLGTKDVLIPAIRLTDLPNINVDTSFEKIEYIHILFEKHEVIFAEGAASESLFPGPEAMKALPVAAQKELCTIFPELFAGSEILITSALPIPERPIQKEIIANLAGRGV